MAFGRKKKNVHRDDESDYSYYENDEYKTDEYNAEEVDTDSYDSYNYDDDSNTPEKPDSKGNVLKVFATLGICVAAVLLIFSIFAVVTGPSKSDCREIIESFEDGCHELDLMKMTNAIDPSYRNHVRAIIMVSETLTDADLEKALELLDSAMGGLLGTASEEGFEGSLESAVKDIRIEPESYGLPGKNRVVRCKVTAGVFETSIKLTMRKKNKETYIAKVTLAED